MKQVIFSLSALCLSAASAFPSMVVADETNFPSRQRTLETVAPAECRDWVAPLPVRRTDVTLPSGAKRMQGAAHLTITITPDGKFGGLVAALANDEVFVQAAAESLQHWSFTPARCNGVNVATQSKVYFNFRHEQFLSFVSGNDRK